MECDKDKKVELSKEKQLIELNLLVTLFQTGKYNEVVSLSKEMSSFLTDGSINSETSIKFNSKIYRMQSKAFFELGQFEEAKRAIDIAIKWNNFNKVNVVENDEESIATLMLNQEHLRKINEALRQIDSNLTAIQSLSASISIGDQEKKDRKSDNNGNLDQEEDDEDDDNNIIYGSDGTCFRRVR